MVKLTFWRKEEPPEDHFAEALKAFVEPANENLEADKIRSELYPQLAEVIRDILQPLNTRLVADLIRHEGRCYLTVRYQKQGKEVEINEFIRQLLLNMWDAYFVGDLPECVQQYPRQGVRVIHYLDIEELLKKSDGKFAYFIPPVKGVSNSLYFVRIIWHVSQYLPIKEVYTISEYRELKAAMLRYGPIWGEAIVTKVEDFPVKLDNIEWRPLASFVRWLESVFNIYNYDENRKEEIVGRVTETLEILRSFVKQSVPAAEMAFLGVVNYIPKEELKPLKELKEIIEKKEYGKISSFLEILEEEDTLKELSQEIEKVLEEEKNIEEAFKEINDKIWSYGRDVLENFGVASVYPDLSFPIALRALASQERKIGVTTIDLDELLERKEEYLRGKIEELERMF